MVPKHTLLRLFVENTTLILLFLLPPGASRLATQFLSRGLQSIVFARSRLRVEILTTYLKAAVRKLGKDHNLVRGYRGGWPASGQQ